MIQIGRKDIVWNYAATFLKIAASALLLPFILRMMPPEMVGIWSVFITITAFSTLLDFGFWHVDAAPAVSFGILMIPLFDTLRVFLLRTIRTGNPFKADRNHLHHLLLNLKLSHFDATLFLIIVNIAFTFLVFKLQFVGVNWLFAILFLAGPLLSYSLHLIVKRRLRLDEATVAGISVPLYHNLNPAISLNENELVGKQVK